MQIVRINSNEKYIWYIINFIDVTKLSLKFSENSL